MITMSQELKSDKNIKKYLNLSFNLKNIPLNEREQALKKISNKLRIGLSPSDYYVISQCENEYTISYALKKFFQNRQFYGFKLAKVQINANISEISANNDLRALTEMTTTNAKNEKITLTVDSDTLAQNIEILARGFISENEDLRNIAHIIVESKLFLITIKNNCEVCEINLNSIMENFQTKIFQDFSNFLQYLREIMDAQYTTTMKRVYFFVHKSILEQKSLHISSFRNAGCVQIRGKIHGIKSNFDPELNEIKYDVDIRDKELNSIHLLISENDSIEDLKVNKYIIAQGYLRWEQNPKLICHYIANEIIDQSNNAISIEYQTKSDVEYHIENDFSKERPGLFIRGYKFGSICDQIRFTVNPVIINAIYRTERDDLLYEIQIGSNTPYFGQIEQIVDELRTGKKPVICSMSMELKPALLNLVRELMIKNKMECQRAYTCVGIHVDEKSNFLLAIPQLLKIIPENDPQKDIVSTIETLDIFDPDTVDPLLQGAIENFVKLVEFEGNPEHFRLVAFGYIAISGFFKVLSKSKSIDVYPAYFAIGSHGAGKTSLLRILIEGLFGYEMKLGNTIESPSRLRDLISASTFPLLVDEIDSIDHHLVIILKSMLTSFSKLAYKTKTQEWIHTDINRSVIGTANGQKWLDDDSAFKEGRAMVTFHETPAQEKYSQPFERIKNAIYSNKAIGYVFVQTIFNMIKGFRQNLNEQSKQNNSDDAPKKQLENDLETLVYMIEEKRKHVRKLAKINNMTFSDNRRVTIHALILIGLEFWQYFFKQKLDVDVPFLAEFLKPDSSKYIAFIKEFEEKNVESKFEEVFQIQSFIETTYNNEEHIPHVFLRKKSLWLTDAFLGKYNEYASRTKYNQFNSLEKLAETLNKVSPEVIKVERKRFFKGEQKQTRCVKFDSNELLKRIKKDLSENDYLPSTDEPYEYDSTAEIELKKLQVQKIQNRLGEMKHIPFFSFEDFFESLAMENVPKEIAEKALKYEVDMKKIGITKENLYFIPDQETEN